MLNLKMANDNIERLKYMIDQILDLAKLQSGKLQLKTSHSDIVSFTEGVINSFASAISRAHDVKLRFKKTR